MHKSRKSPSRALLRREGDSLLFFTASRVKLIHGLLAPLRPTTTYVHGSVSLPRFHSQLCLKEHVELIPSVFITCLNGYNPAIRKGLGIALILLGAIGIESAGLLFGNGRFRFPDSYSDVWALSVYSSIQWRDRYRRLFSWQSFFPATKTETDALQRSM